MSEHKPRYQYDCNRCKFKWCCGYCCACALKHELPKPPKHVQLKVNEALIKEGFEPQFKIKE